jgi:hypothetical protein
MVPPWTPDPVPPDPKQDQPDQLAPPPPVPGAVPAPAVPIAPAGRFGPARASLGRYASSGANGDMQNGLGHYTHKGLGGAKTAAQRMGGTARTAGALYGALSAISSSGQGVGEGAPLDRAALRGRSPKEIIKAIIEAIRPVDGTQDAETDRNALQGALSSELLERFPNADLLDLSEEERLFAIERFAALDVFYRIELDIGNAIKEKAATLTVALSRLREIKNYAKQTVASEFRKLLTAGQTLSPRRIASIVRQAIQDTFAVFEGFAR